MKNLIITLVPVVATLMVANLQMRSESGTVNTTNNNTDRPHPKNGQMPIGNARFGDQSSPNEALSFWQLKALKNNNYQLL